MKTVFFTVDVDRDAAWPENGVVHACSKGRKEPSFTATGKGLQAIVGVLGERGIPATFFFEAKAALVLSSKKTDLPALMEGHEVACHGFDHEDFVGSKTGVKMTRKQKKDLLEKALDELGRVFPGKEITGFRAPYMHCDEELLELVKETGFEYDSSLYSDSKLKPPQGLKELPVTKFSKSFPAYLWALMEGTRAPKEYVEAVKASEGDVVLATHSWHAYHSIEEGVLSKKGVEKNLAKIEAVLDGLKDEHWESI